MTTIEYIAAEIRRRREEHGWSIQRLANRADMTWANLASIEAARQTPTIRTLERLAAALSCALSDLMPPAA